MSTRKLAPILLPAVILVGLALAMIAGATAPDLEITLVARDMAFYEKGKSVPNPTLEAAPGRTIVLTFFNLDRGVEHDLSLAQLGLATPVLPGDGSSEILRFRAPDTPGDHDYTCQLHDRMMRGTLRVGHAR